MSFTSFIFSSNNLIILFFKSSEFSYKSFLALSNFNFIELISTFMSSSILFIGSLDIALISISFFKDLFLMNVSIFSYCLWHLQALNIF